MHDEGGRENLRRYIAATRAQYTREAITEKLREAGYDDNDIDAAWQEDVAMQAAREQFFAAQAEAGKPQPNLWAALAWFVFAWCVSFIVGLGLQIVMALGVEIYSGVSDRLADEVMESVNVLFWVVQVVALGSGLLLILRYKWPILRVLGVLAALPMLKAAAASAARGRWRSPA